MMLADGEIVDEHASNFALEVSDIEEKNPTSKIRGSEQEGSHVKT